MAAYSLKVSATDAVRSTSKPSTTSVVEAAVLQAFNSLCTSAAIILIPCPAKCRSVLRPPHHSFTALSEQVLLLAAHNGVVQAG